MLEDLFYTGSGLDRAANQRRDEDWVAQSLRHRSTRIVPVWRHQSLFLQSSESVITPVTITGPHARGILQIAQHVTLLGLRPDDEDGETAYFAVDLSEHESPMLTPAIGQAEFMDLRQVAPLLQPWEGSILAYARGMMFWHQQHRFCGSCGSETAPRQGGHMRQCGNEDCSRQHFPRTDPAVIMLVERPGPDGGAVLLSHQSQWPAGMYSILAGFVEPGESLEEAVAREVMEETNIRIKDIRYRASQPWPFPSSLMTGYRAVAETVKIDFDREELEDARWFTRKQVAEMGEVSDPNHPGPRLPRHDSIARHILDEWLAESPL